MKLRNISSQAVQVLDEHAGRGALVEPGGETPELSEQTARELLELEHVWQAVGEKAVRTSGKRKAGST